MSLTQRIVAAILFAGLTNVSSAQSVQQLIAKSDAAAQAQIHTIVDALDLRGIDPRRNVDAFREVQELNKLTDDKEKLVEQLAIYAATTSSEEDMHVMLALMIVRFLDLQPDVPIRVLAPYLDANNKQLRDFAVTWFVSHDGSAAASATAPLFQMADYQEYLEYVGKKLARGEEVPTGFVEYVYQRSPGRALLVFAYADRSVDASVRLQAIGKAIEARQQGKELSVKQESDKQFELDRQARAKTRREIKLGEHLVSNALWLKDNRFNDRFHAALPEAKAELAKISKHDEWWAQLYVAEIMRRHRELRDEAIVEQLRKDQHALVSKTAKSIPATK